MNSAPLVGVSRLLDDWLWEYLLEDREREPDQEDELESVVEGEPVDNAHETLHDAERGVSTGARRSGWEPATHVKKEKTTQY